MHLLYLIPDVRSQVTFPVKGLMCRVEEMLSNYYDHFHSYHELDEEDCQQVEQLVFCSHRQVAHEAGSFLNERLLAEAENSSPTKKKG